MHFHTLPQEPGAQPAFCPEHMPDDEGLSECWSERCVCVVCEDLEYLPAVSSNVPAVRGANSGLTAGDFGLVSENPSHILRLEGA